MSALSKDDVLAALRRGAERFYAGFPAMSFNTPEWRAARVESFVQIFGGERENLVLASFGASRVEQFARDELAAAWLGSLSRRP